MEYLKSTRKASTAPAAFEARTRIQSGGDTTQAGPRETASSTQRLGDLDGQSGRYTGSSATPSDDAQVMEQSNSDIVPKSSRKDSDPAGDAAIAEINEQRRSDAQEINDRRAAAAGPGEEVKKVEPKFLTADEQTDVRDIHARLKAEGRPDEAALQTTSHLMKPKDMQIRSELRENNEIGANAAPKPDQTLTKVVTDYELSKINLNSLNKGFGDAVTALKNSSFGVQIQ